MNSLRRRIMASKEDSNLEYVDLGLPSGILWAKGNIVKDAVSETYSMGKPSDRGCYFSWGDIIGHIGGEGINYNQSRYDNTPGSDLTTNIPANNTYDAARAYFGGSWRIPTMGEFKELKTNTIQEWGTLDSINGYFFYKKDNSGNKVADIYVFFPLTGMYNGPISYGLNTDGYYWTSTYYDSSNANVLYFNSSSVNADGAMLYRYYGFNIRPVCHKIPEYIDFGLPSGLKWATCNIGANSPEGRGLYFSWGNVDGHYNGEGYNFGSDNTGPYANTPGASVTSNIASNDALHDAAFANLGSPWRMPTRYDFKELVNNTDYEKVQINGVAGWKFMKKTDHNVFIFLPVGGYGYKTWIADVNRWVQYWESTYHSSGNLAWDLRSDITNATSNPNPEAGDYRYRGQNIRAVQ